MVVASSNAQTKEPWEEAIIRFIIIAVLIRPATILAFCAFYKLRDALVQRFAEEAQIMIWDLSTNGTDQIPFLGDHACHGTKVQNSVQQSTLTSPFVSP